MPKNIETFTIPERSRQPILAAIETKLESITELIDMTKQLIRYSPYKQDVPGLQAQLAEARNSLSETLQARQDVAAGLKRSIGEMLKMPASH